MTVTSSAAPVECSCGETFPYASAAAKHRDRIPAAERAEHKISNLPPVAGERPAQAAKPAVPLRAVPDQPQTATPPPVTTAGIVWQDPPARRRGGKFPVSDKVLALLKANPDRWALVHTYGKPSSASTAAGGINKGTTSLGAGWEAKGARSEAGSDLYLRWVGTE